MASIKKRGSSYTITVSSGYDINGKQVLHYKKYVPKGKTLAAIRRELETVAMEFEEEVKAGKYLDGDHLSFEQLIERWQENYASTNLSQTTIDSNMNILQLHFIPALGKMKISKITALHLQTLINKMLDDGLSPCTVRRNFAVVSAILQKAYKWGLVQENVARRCELPRYERAEMQFWNAEQARTFLKALTLPYSFSCKGHNRTLGSTGAGYKVRRYDRKYTVSRAWREFFNLELHTGMRRGELCGLRWCDVDFENRECIVFGKGNKQRKVYFDARTKIHLQRYLAERTDTGEALFVSLLKPYGRLQISGVEIRLRKIGRELNFQKVHPHKFRRTLATMAIDKGMPIEQVQQLLGHQSIDTTLQYAMVNQNNVKESHRKFIG